MSGMGISDLGFSQFTEQVRQAGVADMPRNMVSQEQLKQVAQAFEQILMGIMVDSMRETIPESGLLPETPGHGVYDQMLDQEYVREATEAGSMSLGLAAAFERQFSGMVLPSSAPALPESLNSTERSTAGS